jgi:uncharacterized protein (TIGR00369 family)
MTDPMERLAYRTPAAEHLGREVLEVDPDAREVRLRFRGRPEFTNRHGGLHGGILGAMLDSAMACTLMSVLEPEERASTLEIKTSFLRAAPLGELRALGRVIHRGGRVAFLESEMRDLDGDLLATATATFRILRGNRDGKD